MCPEDLVAISQNEIVNLAQTPSSRTWSIDDSLLPRRTAPKVMPKVTVKLEEEPKAAPPRFPTEMVLYLVGFFVLCALAIMLNIPELLFSFLLF